MVTSTTNNSTIESNTLAECGTATNVNELVALINSATCNTVQKYNSGGTSSNSYNYTAKVWEKNGLTRIYVRSRKGGDVGYYDIKDGKATFSTKNPFFVAFELTSSPVAASGLPVNHPAARLARETDVALAKLNKAVAEGGDVYWAQREYADAIERESAL